MGWTWYIATHYKDGKINRKAECDSLFTQNEQDKVYYQKEYHLPKMTVLKSVMKGSVYYGAIESINSLTNVKKIFAVVCKTSVEGMEFGYKDMDETCGPYYFDCPNSILEILSETDNELALEWRKKCREQNEQNKEISKSKKLLKELPLGSKIKFNSLNNLSNGVEIGDEIILTKINVSNNKWFDGAYTWPSKFINHNFEILNY